MLRQLAQFGHDDVTQFQSFGLTLLGDALRQQQTETVQIDWRPPKEVNLSPRILEILSKLE